MAERYDAGARKRRWVTFSWKDECRKPQSDR